MYCNFEKKKEHPFMADEISFQGKKLFSAIEKGCNLPEGFIILNRPSLSDKIKQFCTYKSDPNDILYLYNCIMCCELNTIVFDLSGIKLKHMKSFFKEWLDKREIKLC